MKALITGINGFAGSWLAANLVEQGWLVCGTVQPGTSLDNIGPVKAKLSLLDADILDRNSVDHVLSSVKPEVVFHLAGASSVKESFDRPDLFIEVNVGGSLNLLEGVKKIVPQAKVVLVTSAEIYGESLSPVTVTDENSRILPKSPYAVSKAALDMMGRVYALNTDLKIVIARPFNHFGPRQTDVFFIPTVAKQIAEVMKGKRSAEIIVGNLDLRRDFTDVRDIVQAYVFLAQKGRAGEAYNICSGKTYLLKDIAQTLIQLSGKKISIKIDPARFRKADLLDMKLSNSKIMAETDWKPRIKIEQTLKDTLDYWFAQA